MRALRLQESSAAQRSRDLFLPLLRKRAERRAGFAAPLPQQVERDLDAGHAHAADDLLVERADALLEASGLGSLAGPEAAVHPDRRAGCQVAHRDDAADRAQLERA